MPRRVVSGGGADRNTLVAFLLMVMIAGGNAVAIRYVSCGTCPLDPFWAAGSRFAIAAAIFAVAAMARQAALPGTRGLAGAILYGGLTFGGAFGFAYWGFVRVPAGLGGVLLATVPLMTFLFALAQGQERFRREALVGAGLAIGGTAVIFRDGVVAGAPLTRMLALLAGSACFAQGAIVVKRFPPVDPAVMNAVGMATGAAILLVLAMVFDEAFTVPATSVVWRAQLYLVVFGSVAVFGLYLFVLRTWTASATSYEGVLIPLVTVVLSAWLLDEQIHQAFVIGSALVVIGVYFGALRSPSGSG